MAKYRRLRQRLIDHAAAIFRDQPAVFTLSLHGGYAPDVDAIVTIHATIAEAVRIARLPSCV